MKYTPLGFDMRNSLIFQEESINLSTYVANVEKEVLEDADCGEAVESWKTMISVLGSSAETGVFPIFESSHNTTQISIMLVTDYFYMNLKVGGGHPSFQNMVVCRPSQGERKAWVEGCSVDNYQLSILRD